MEKLIALIATCILLTICSTAQTRIAIDEAAKHVGETVTICGQVYGGKFLESSSAQPTLLNMGGIYPNHKLTVLINPADRKNFTGKPEDS